MGIVLAHPLGHRNQLISSPSFFNRFFRHSTFDRSECKHISLAIFSREGKIKIKKKEKSENKNRFVRKSILSIYLPIYPSVYLSLHLSTRLSSTIGQRIRGPLNPCPCNESNTASHPECYIAPTVPASHFASNHTSPSISI